MRKLLAVVVIMLLGRSASAQPPGETPVKRVERKSVATAYLFMIAATAAPLATSALGADGDGRDAAVFGGIGVAGLVLGPSAGHWYAGEWVTTGLVLRVGAAGAMVALAVNDPQLEHPTQTVMGLIAAGALWETGVIWDAVTLPRAIRRYNREHQLQVTPMVTAHGPATGIALAGTF